MTRTARLSVKVVPHAARTELVGWIGDALKVRVTAPPERGKANAAVIEALAMAVGVARERVHLIAGEARERKVFAVDGMAASELRTLIDRSLAKSPRANKP